MQENNSEYNDKGPNKEDNEQILVYDLVDDQALRYMKKDELSSPEIIIIDVKDCKTAKEVFSKLSTQDIFVKDDNNDNVLHLKDGNKKIFWLKVDDKLYIKFDSYIQLDDDLLSSIQYRINDNDKKEDKPRLPVVSFNEDCICLQFNNLIQDQDKYTIDDSKIFHFHKNEEVRSKGRFYFHKKGDPYFSNKDSELAGKLYKCERTFLSNIGDTYSYKPLYLPVSLCGINVMKDEFGGSLCLCGTGCCSPYGIMDTKEVMDLENDIFPQFNLEKANKQNEENIIQ